MARSRSDISNSAIRIFLQDVGRFYDSVRSFEPFVPKKSQKEELLNYFGHKCCYCGMNLDVKTLSQDHLIPMNKVSLGLHAWGNVVPCCNQCNNIKQQKPWQTFLSERASPDKAEARKNIIEAFIENKQYNPNLDLHQFADNLYEDVGAVAMTLIQLRYKQAQEAIEALLEDQI